MIMEHMIISTLSNEQLIFKFNILYILPLCFNNFNKFYHESNLFLLYNIYLNIIRIITMF